MAHFVKLDETNHVIEKIVAEQEFIDTLDGTWIQTSYNTYGGVHSDGGTPLRKNFAGVGNIYDADRDAFYESKPYPSWTLDGDTCLWEAPESLPDDDKDYMWNEETKKWVEVTE